MADAPILFLGVDGGATRCRTRLRDVEGRILAETEGPAANVYVDFEGAMQVVRDYAARALAQAGARPAETAIGLGLAGLSDSADAARVLAALPGWARVAPANDASAACLGAHAGADGGLIISGTGSAAIARVNGRETIVGGRGFWLGDDGAAARVGCDAVRAAMRAHDGLEPMSGLSKRILAHFDFDPLRMLDWAPTARPNDYGAFAPWALEAAHAGEPGARAILEAAGRAVATLANAVEKLGARRLAIVGGLAEPLRPFLPPGLSEKLHAPLFDPADGAVLLAGGRLPEART